jgi:hypothetical protein
MVDDNEIRENYDAGSNQLDLADDSLNLTKAQSDYCEMLLRQLAERGLDDHPVTDEAMILLAATHLGAKEATIAEKLGLGLKYVSAVGARLRAGGIWIDDRVAHAERWKECLMMFVLDALVAAGELDCAHEHGQPNYRPKNRDALEMLLACLRPDHVRSRTVTEIQSDLERHGVCLDGATAQKWLREAYDSYTDMLRRFPELC